MADTQACYENSKYDPMDDIVGQARTKESDAAICQTRCQGVEACIYFSYYPDRGCHLSSIAAKKTGASGGIAGPKACTGLFGTKAGDKAVKATG